jgi:uncharacterized protein (TIGR02145 family)
MRSKLFVFLSAFFIMLLLFNSCKEEEPVKTIPVVTTDSITDITEFTATCNATISDDGGAEITIRGFVWDTTSSPSLETNLGFSENGTGTGSFTNTLTELSHETSYYVIAYATNEIGTAYSEEVEFSTSELTWNGTSCTDCETVTDVDGNVYRTVSVGDQCWLVENLKTTKFNDGADISNVTNNDDWNSLSIAAFAWYDNDITNKDADGAIYNYYAVATDKLCPTGWHVATDNEWKELEGFVDSQYGLGNAEWDAASWRGDDVGVKLKTRYDWNFEGNGTDDFGFEVYPNGFRDAVSGEFERKNEWGTIWTDKNGTETDNYRREFSVQEDRSARYNCSPRSGYAVRCLKD